MICARRWHLWSVLFWIAMGNGILAAQETMSLELGSGIMMELVRIPKGTFTQGSPPSEVGRGDDEAPREVTLSKDF